MDESLESAAEPSAEVPNAPGLSPGAVAAAEWLRDLSRTAKTTRLYRSANPVVDQARADFARLTKELLEAAGGWTFRITPEEILLGDEMIVHPHRRGAARGETAQRLISELPFRLYRDGVRELTLMPGIPDRDIDALVDALALSWTDRDRADDIVTALWQANPTHIRVDAAPPEQPLFVATGMGPPERADRGLGLGLGLPPLAAEIRGELGDRGGAVGLQREHGLEESPPPVYMSARHAYEELRREDEGGRDRLLEAWRAENAQDWRSEAAALFAQVLAVEDVPAARAALARLTITGVAHAIDRARWTEATELTRLLSDLDADAESSSALLRDTLDGRSEIELGESLDGALPAELDAFFMMLMTIGEAGSPLAIAALRGTRTERTRAAACAALAYLCAQNPAALSRALVSSSSAIVVHAISVLGHIGGRDAAVVCAPVARHPDPDVTCELARAIPAFPDPERTNLTLALLDNADESTVLLALRSARRERNRQVAQAVVRLLELPETDKRSDEFRRTLHQTLVDVGDATIVPALEAHLVQGGWFARPNWRRSGAGQALARLGVPEAAAALARGRAHKAEAVRAACGETTERRAA